MLLGEDLIEDVVGEETVLMGRGVDDVGDFVEQFSRRFEEVGSGGGGGSGFALGHFVVREWLLHGRS